jgi:hypothetical protein
MQVFISYSRKFTYPAEVIKSLLEHEGYSVWIDLEGIQGGDIWERSIREGIRSSGVVIVLVTSPALESQPIKKEIVICKEFNREIVPIIIEKFSDDGEALGKLGLSDRHAINFATQSRERAEIQLTQAIKAISDNWTALRPFIEKLNSSDAKVRVQTVKRLGELRLAAAFPLFVRLLSDEDFAIKQEAIIGLGELGDDQAVEPLIELINSHRQIPMKDKSTLEGLHFNSNLSLTVEYALTTLDGLQSTRAVDFLISLLTAEDSIMDWEMECVVASTKRRK